MADSRQLKKTTQVLIELCRIEICVCCRVRGPACVLIELCRIEICQHRPRAHPAGVLIELCRIEIKSSTRCTAPTAF